MDRELRILAIDRKEILTQSAICSAYYRISKDIEKGIRSPRLVVLTRNLTKTKPAFTNLLCIQQSIMGVSINKLNFAVNLKPGLLQIHMFSSVVNTLNYNIK